MTRKKILGSHVKRLLSGVSDHGKQHLSEVETDLKQTHLLLEEAIEKLTASFMAIHTAVGRPAGHYQPAARWRHPERGRERAPGRTCRAKSACT